MRWINGSSKEGDGPELTYISRSFTPGKREVKALAQVSFHTERSGSFRGPEGDSGRSEREDGRLTIAQRMFGTGWSSLRETWRKELVGFVESRMPVSI
ncbi:hypothetical protein [Allomesorhizobium camelthorni]|uniref:Uncharacterized protein n=1 Tax=Allomesorhizobium camelthorni TaxID=475069 RepID=A0A6G4WLR2_9HYPH|nr:hypothetical protein [Mesorhizobium camelthorni]NGO55146.1 hypothetical protein [Mesorhizobium camelthorni]